MTTLIAPHPFGHSITAESLTATFARFQQWEDRYRHLIQLSRQLPALPDALKSAENELTGCENRVWFSCQQLPDGTLHFYGDSEGRIVRGLLAILLTAAEGKTPAQLLNEDPLALFETLGLRAQLSASRSSGLQALADAVKQAARHYQEA